jgi:hypothetical protein
MLISFYSYNKEAMLGILMLTAKSKIFWSRTRLEKQLIRKFSWNFLLSMFICVLHFQDSTQLNIFSSYVNILPPGLNEPNGPLTKPLT